MWSLDSDVASMCPRYCAVTGIKELFLKMGTYQNKRFVHAMTEELGEDMSLVLPSIHACNGCDFTSAFSGMGKERGIKIVNTPRTDGQFEGSR